MSIVEAAGARLATAGPVKAPVDRLLAEAPKVPATGVGWPKITRLTSARFWVGAAFAEAGKCMTEVERIRAVRVGRSIFAATNS